MYHCTCVHVYNYTCNQLFWSWFECFNPTFQSLALYSFECMPRGGWVQGAAGQPSGYIDSQVWVWGLCLPALILSYLSTGKAGQKHKQTRRKPASSDIADWFASMDFPEFEFVVGRLSALICCEYSNLSDAELWIPKQMTNYKQWKICRRQLKSWHGGWNARKCNKGSCKCRTRVGANREAGCAVWNRKWNSSPVETVGSADTQGALS